MLKLARSESKLQESVTTQSHQYPPPPPPIIIINITITISFNLAVVLVSSVASTLVMKWMLRTLAYFMSRLYSAASFFSQWSLRKSDSSPLTSTSPLCQLKKVIATTYYSHAAASYPWVGSGNILNSVWMWPNPVHQKRAPQSAMLRLRSILGFVGVSMWCPGCVFCTRCGQSKEARPCCSMFDWARGLRMIAAVSLDLFENGRLRMIKIDKATVWGFHRSSKMFAIL